MTDYIVLDLETIADPNLNEMEQQKINSFENEKEKSEYIDRLPLSPYSGNIFCLGLKSTERGKKWILINFPFEDEKQFASPDENTKYVFFKTEKELLEGFWKWISKQDKFKFLTFNGREFDMPYILLRSAVLEVEPTMNLMQGTEYNFEQFHLDLIKKLTFYKYGNSGPLQKKSLDYYLRVYGLESSKTEGVYGGIVTLLHKEGRYQEIVEYNGRDLDKTEELYTRLVGFLI